MKKYLLLLTALLAPVAFGATRSVPSQYSTIQAAVNAAASGDTIAIAAGNYGQTVSIPGSKTKLTIIGAGKTATRVYAGLNKDTFNIAGSDILIKNLTIENTAGGNASPPQQQAVYLTGKKVSFNNVLIKAWQDGLQMKAGSLSYYYNCEIQGSVDYIYDGGTAFFENCKTVQRRTVTGAVDCAPATPSGARGIVFWKCSITPVSGLANGRYYLARVWGSTGEVAYINCSIGAHIAPAGYLHWNENSSSRVAEYPCPSSRASWCKRLTSDANHTKAKILGSWVPRL